MRKSVRENPFPRLLIGTALIFWGWMADLSLAGLLMALVLEAVHWIPWRWDFLAKAHVRAWNLSVVLMVVTAAFLWMSGVQPETVRKFLSWMPLFFFPLAFTQCFGRSTTIPLSTFSYFSRRKMEADRLLGITVREQEISFLGIYFMVLMVVSAAGAKAVSSYYIIGLLLLTTWAVWARREKTRSVIAISAALLVVIALTFVGQWGLSAAHDFILKAGGKKEWQSGDTHWNRTRTRIGHMGMIKQSPDIFWRLKVEHGKAPALLKMACYNRYLPSGSWNYDPPDGITLLDDIAGLGVIGNVQRLADGNVDTSIDTPLYRTTGNLIGGEEARSDLPRFVLRGGVRDRSGVPLPTKLHTIYASLQDLEKNSVGSIRITPRHAVLNAIVRWGAQTDTDGMPFAIEDGLSPDLQIPDTERIHLRKLVDELKLREMDFPTQCRTLQSYFVRNFSYTKDLAIGAFVDQMRERGQLGLKNGNTPLAQFLHEVKAGHCEYFATATTLLLREAGVKARYCVGFSVQEYNEDKAEYVLRGVHGHAWCRAWDEPSQTWVDLDFTPGSWILGDAVQQDWRREMADFFVRLREDFTVWRTQPENQDWVLTVLSIIAAAIITWIGYRLWKTRSISTRRKISPDYTGGNTPLNDLEPLLAKYFGPRKTNQTLAAWICGSPEILPVTVVDEIVTLHQNWRFGTQPVTDPTRTRLVTLCQEIKRSLKSRKSKIIIVPSSRRGS